MNSILPIPRQNLEQLLETLQDAECEMGEPEVTELISNKLDVKMTKAIIYLEELLDEED